MFRNFRSQKINLDPKTREKFWKLYLRFRRRIVPGLRSTLYYYEYMLKTHVHTNSKWLDLGCGHQLLPKWIPFVQEKLTSLDGKSKIIVGMDYDISSLKKHECIKHLVVGDIHKLPFRENTFDLVTANRVVEHIENPLQACKEIKTILVNNGNFLFFTPNLLNYKIAIAHILPEKIKRKIAIILENRNEIDIFETFYRMNTKNKIKRIAKHTNISIKTMIFRNGNASTSILGPLVILELLIIKILNFKFFSYLRSNIICVLQK